MIQASEKGKSIYRGSVQACVILSVVFVFNLPKYCPVWAKMKEIYKFLLQMVNICFVFFFIIGFFNWLFYL